MTSKHTSTNKGKLCEQKALVFFQKKGWRLIAKNQQLKGIEIDLVLKKASTYLLVEVKSDNLWRREFPINIKQKKRLMEAFSVFCEQHENPVQIQLAIVDEKSNIHTFDLDF